VGTQADLERRRPGTRGERLGTGYEDAEQERGADDGEPTHEKPFRGPVSTSSPDRGARA
jgi:hypothetical protein